MTSHSGDVGTSSLTTTGDGPTATDEQLFVEFLERVRQNTLGLDIRVSKADIDFYICWGAERWLHRFSPERARLEGDRQQVTEALAKIRATLKA